MFQPETKAETKLLVSTETLTDTEREVSELVRKIQSYNWKLTNKVGKQETAENNIREAFRVIDLLTKDTPISHILTGKVEEYRQLFKNIL